MIETLQNRFIFTAMIAITLLIVVVLGAVNVFNAVSFMQETEDILSLLDEYGGLPPGLGPDPLPIPDGSEGTRGDLDYSTLGEDDLLAVRFFTVVMGADMAVREIDISRISSVDPVQAASYAADVIREPGTEGSIDSFRYIKRLQGEETQVIFLSVENQWSMIFDVLLVSIGVGLMAWLIMLFIVVQLSRRAIRPIAESIEKQKQFVTDAGHEIKTPLAIIMANTDALELHTGETKWSRNIRAQTVRLSGLMQNLLTLSRADEGLLMPEMTEVDVSALLDEALYPFIEAAALKGVVIESDILTNVTVQGSEDHLARLFSILLDNAVKYVQKDGKISVTLDRRDTTMRMKISNSCDQKPAEDLDRLFDRFYRGDAARTHKGGGYGIGLSAARAIVLVHKGEIRASYAHDTMTFTVEI